MDSGGGGYDSDAARGRHEGCGPPVLHTPRTPPLATQRALFGSSIGGSTTDAGAAGASGVALGGVALGVGSIGVGGAPVSAPAHAAILGDPAACGAGADAAASPGPTPLDPLTVMWVSSIRKAVVRDAKRSHAFLAEYLGRIHTALAAIRHAADAANAKLQGRVTVRLLTPVKVRLQDLVTWVDPASSASSLPCCPPHHEARQRVWCLPGAGGPGDGAPHAGAGASHDGGHAGAGASHDGGHAARQDALHWARRDRAEEDGCLAGVSDAGTLLRGLAVDDARAAFPTTVLVAVDMIDAAGRVVCSVIPASSVCDMLCSDRRTLAKVLRHGPEAEETGAGSPSFQLRKKLDDARVPPVASALLTEVEKACRLLHAAILTRGDDYMTILSAKARAGSRSKWLTFAEASRQVSWGLAYWEAGQAQTHGDGRVRSANSVSAATAAPSWGGTLLARCIARWRNTPSLLRATSRRRTYLCEVAVRVNFFFEAAGAPVLHGFLRPAGAEAEASDGEETEAGDGDAVLPGGLLVSAVLQAVPTFMMPGRGRRNAAKRVQRAPGTRAGAASGRKEEEEDTEEAITLPPEHASVLQHLVATGSTRVPETRRSLVIAAASAADTPAAWAKVQHVGVGGERSEASDTARTWWVHGPVRANRGFSNTSAGAWANFKAAYRKYRRTPVLTHMVRPYGAVQSGSKEPDQELAAFAELFGFVAMCIRAATPSRALLRVAAAELGIVPRAGGGHGGSPSFDDCMDAVLAAATSPRMLWATNAAAGSGGNSSLVLPLLGEWARWHLRLRPSSDLTSKRAGTFARVVGFLKESLVQSGGDAEAIRRLQNVVSMAGQSRVHSKTDARRARSRAGTKQGYTPPLAAFSRLRVGLADAWRTACQARGAVDNPGAGAGAGGAGAGAGAGATHADVDLWQRATRLLQMRLLVTLLTAIPCDRPTVLLHMRFGSSVQEQAGGGGGAWIRVRPASRTLLSRAPGPRCFRAAPPSS